MLTPILIENESTQQSLQSDAETPDFKANESVVQTATRIRDFSQKLDDWYPDGQMLVPTYPTDLNLLHSDLVLRLIQWVVQPQSQVLYLELPTTPGEPAPSTLIAAHLVSVAVQTNRPLLSYSCALPRGKMPEGRIPETIALCELMASLIRQLTMMLPEQLPTGCPDLSAERFAKLDGTLNTWSEMLSLFGDLIKPVQESLFIIIDGLHWLDSPYTEAKLKSLLDLIRYQMNKACETDNKPNKGKTIKMLLTTGGHARGVVPWLRRGEHYLQEEGGAGKRVRTLDFAHF
jgi:hypothetical protein